MGRMVKSVKRSVMVCGDMESHSVAWLSVMRMAVRFDFAVGVVGGEGREAAR